MLEVSATVSGKSERFSLILERDVQDVGGLKRGLHAITKVPYLQVRFYAFLVICFSRLGLLKEGKKFPKP